jgi:adhesin transport system membrane fusion protein
MTDATLSPLETLVAQQPLRNGRILSWMIMAALAAGITWSFYAELEQVSMAPGEVVPQTKLKVIQHLEGGIIQKMMVQEGDTVSEGTPLMQLDLAVTSINRDEIQVRLDSMALTKARLQAEASVKPLVYPKEEAARRPDLVRGEQQAYDSRKRELDSVLSSIADQMRQRELSVRELEATNRAKRADLALMRERLSISEKLLKESLTPRIEHLKLQSDVERLDGEISTLNASIPRAVSALAEARGRIEEEKAKFQRRAYEELNAVELNYARTVELLSEASDQRRRALVTSPIDGVVKNMKFSTVGGVVRPGEPIMEIVPTGDRLVIEAKLSPTDRGYVQVGQPARVKVSTYDYVRYGALEGKVTLIAADANTEQNGQPYFRVIVETEKSHLGDDGFSYPITPGMQAIVDIETGHRSVAFYLMKPVLKLKNEAFRER